MQGRSLCKISLLIILIIAFSAYGPRDYLGLYRRANTVDMLLSDGDRVTSWGQIYRKEIKNNQTLYYVKNAQVNIAGGTISDLSFSFKLDSDLIPIKSKINLIGVVEKFQKPRNQGEFDLDRYYKSLGIYFQLTDVEVLDYQEAGYDFDFFYRVNKNICSVYEKLLPDEEAGLLSSIAVGNKSFLHKLLKGIFQDVGLSHILVVSGLHTGLVCMALYRFLRWLGLGFGSSGVMSAVVSLLYGALTGNSISAIRAIGMFLVYLLAQYFGESYDMLTATALMAVLILFDNPLYILNGSYLMSFGAVLGIWYVAMPLSKLWKFKNKVLNKLVGSLLFSFGINIAMLPLVASMYFEIPAYSLIINLLVLPMMPMLLGLGLFAGFIGVFCLTLGNIFILPCHFIIYFMEMTSDIVASLPHSKIVVGHRDILWILGYYIVLFMIMKSVRAVKDNSTYKSRFIKLVALVCLYGIFLFPKAKPFEIDFLDVGQGDGIYISSGDGVDFFIDGGSTSKKDVGQYTILPFLKYKGVTDIDYWFISHMDEDHVSGLFEILESGYRVDNIVFSDEILRDDKYNELLKAAKESNTNILYMNCGDIIETKHLSFKCVYPFEDITNSDINALSLSLLMEYDENLNSVCDYSGFFGGDIAMEQERLIAESGLIDDVDFLKVSHHGSRFSSDEAFVRLLHPRISIISCAKKNRYGHPADESIIRIESAGSTIFYTMNSGQITISKGKIKEFVETSNND